MILNYLVTIFIPVLNPTSDFFEQTVPLLEAQSIVARVVLISSSGMLPRGNYESIVIEKDSFNHANTRNLALAYESDFYLFMTQDATPFDTNLLANLFESFHDADVVVSYARQIPYENAPIIERFARGKNYPDTSLVKSKEDIGRLGIKTFFSSDSCAMYRGSYFRKCEGFRKNLNTSEDMEFAHRAIFDNKKVAYCAEAKVYHSHIYTFKTIYKRYVTIGEFFRDNPTIQESIANSISTEKSGFLQVIEEFSYVLRHKPIAIFQSFLFTVIKYVAYKKGKGDF